MKSTTPGWGERLLTGICQVWAVIGGLVLVALTLLTVASVVGRSVFGRPLPGDFELVEVGSAIAIFAFLPYCQLRRGHVVVDFFTARASPRLNAGLAAVGDGLFMLIAALLTWRLTLGGLELQAYNEQSMVLRLPLWWSFLFIVPACGLLTVVCAYTAWQRLRELRA